MKQGTKIFIGALVLILIQALFLNTASFGFIFKSCYEAIKPFIYALFIAILMIPLVNFFEGRYRLRRWFAMTISFIIVLTLFLTLLLIVIPNMINSLLDLFGKTSILLGSLNYHLGKIMKFLKAKNLLFFDLSGLENSIITFIKTNIGNLKTVVFGLSVGILKSVNILINLFLAVFVSFYLIYNKEYFLKFRRNLISLFCNEDRTDYIIDFLNKSNDIFLKYITGRILTSAIVGIIVFLILFIAKVPYALLSGVLIGVGNMIPYVGSIVAGAIATFLIFLISPIKVIYLFIAILVGQTVDGFIVGPKIMEESVGMSSFWTIIAIMVCGNLFGPVGMFFSVPLFAVLKIVYLEKLRNRNLKGNEDNEKV